MNERVGSRNIVYRNPLNDIPDQYLFFVLFLVGGAAIWGLKLRGYDQIIVTAVPLALMAVYTGLAVVTKRYRVREDKVGDNIYYLGFLYTLVSLAYALWTFTSDGSAAESIITNFGIAILTTITGLAGRVFFNQMREDPIEYEREARTSLAEASREMKAQLDDISVEMSSFKRRLTQIIEEGVTDISNKANDSLQANVSKFADVGTHVIEKIQAAFDTFAQQSSTLNTIASKNVDALEALFHRIERIEASPDLLASKLDPVMARFAEAADEALKRSRAHASDVKKLREILDTVVQAAVALQNAVHATDQDTNQKLTALGSQIEAITASTRGLASALREASETLSSDLEANRTTAARVRQALEEHVQASSNVLAGLRETVETVAQDARSALVSARNAVAADLAAMQRHREEAQTVLADSRQMMAELETTLVSLAGTMTEQLRAS